MTVTPSVVRIGSPGDIAAAVPHLLGFVPTESIVVIGLHGPRRRFGLTLRFDLLPRQYNTKVAGMLARRSKFAAPDEIVVLIFTAKPDGDDLVRRDLVEAVMAKSKVPVADAVLVRDGRWWSYVCDDPRCCPPDGTPIDTASAGSLALAAAQAMTGRTVLANREAVVQSLAPVTGTAAQAADKAVDRVMDEVRAETSELRQERALALLDELTARFQDPRAAISDDEAAYIQVACGDIRVRDAVLEHVGPNDPASRDVPDRIEAVTRVLRDVARRAPPDIAAPTWTILAWVSYGEGNGVVANVALDHALAADPDYSLAQLLREALDRQVPPSLIRAR